MNNSSHTKVWVRRTAIILLLLFFTSLFFSIRFLVAILCPALFAFALTGFYQLSPGTRMDKKPVYLAGFAVLFFLVQLVWLLFTSNTAEGWKNIWMKSAVVMTIAGVYGTINLIRDLAVKIKFYYCCLLAASCLFYLSSASIDYFQTKDSSAFFYYALVDITDQHAIFYSVYVFTGLVLINEALYRQKLYIAPLFYYLMLILFLVVLTLLSSKLVIVCFLLFSIYFFFLYLANRKKKWILPFAMIAFLTVAGLFFLSGNPITKRFRELFKGDMSLVYNDQNTPGDYFNGFQFRLLQWKIVPEILTEQNAWVKGVSPGDAQKFLDRKYSERNMYVGDPKTGNEGFIGYYTHNSFLECLLQTGVIGLVIFLGMYGMLVLLMVSKKDFVLLWVTGLIIALSFTESLFESQYGIALFGLLPVFTWSTSFHEN